MQWSSGPYGRTHMTLKIARRNSSSLIVCNHWSVTRSISTLIISWFISRGMCTVDMNAHTQFHQSLNINLTLAQCNCTVKAPQWVHSQWFTTLELTSHSPMSIHDTALRYLRSVLRVYGTPFGLERMLFYSDDSPGFVNFKMFDGSSLILSWCPII